MDSRQRKGTMRRWPALLLLTATLLAPGLRADAAEHHQRHWGYEGTAGPTHWQELPGCAGCAGHQQAPIDITGERDDAHLPEVRFHYHATRLDVVNNGHTIEVDEEDGGRLTYGTHPYKLVQFHFHHPSEHRLHGRSFPLEVHFVHKDAQGHLLVVAALVNPGAWNHAYDLIWSHLPGHAGEHWRSRQTFDPSSLLPHDRDYYTYAGSLTTPPCTEGVRWLVLARPVTLSHKQIDRFARLYPHNNRPIQPRHERVVEHKGHH